MTLTGRTGSLLQCFSNLGGVVQKCGADVLSMDHFQAH